MCVRIYVPLGLVHDICFTILYKHEQNKQTDVATNYPDLLVTFGCRRKKHLL